MRRAIQSGAVLDNLALSLNLLGKMTPGYSPVVIFWILAVGLAGAMLFLSVFFGVKRFSESKSAAYESGITSVGDASGRFPVKYYLIGALFILFDIEAVFLIAWAVVSKEFGALAVIELGAFLLAVVAGYFYVLFKGVLD